MEFSIQENDIDNEYEAEEHSVSKLLDDIKNPEISYGSSDRDDKINYTNKKDGIRRSDDDDGSKECIKKLKNQLIEAKLKLSYSEADQEEILDKLFLTERERDLAYFELIETQRQKDEMREKLIILESSISNSLHERDIAFGEEYVMSSQMTDFNKTSPKIAIALKGADEVQAEKLEKALIETKLELAEIKEKYDKRQLAYRSLETEFVAVKLELAQAISMEDDYRISLDHASREKELLQKQLVQLSAKLAALHGMS